MNIIDLFSGCGGMSLGFEEAGFNVKVAIEMDDWASETYKKNHNKTRVITKNITEIIDLKTIFDCETHIDGIIGGPPCQGFSLSGNRDKKDPRNSLFMEFVRFVKFYKPKFFVMENVTGILSMKTQNNEYVKDIILNEFDKAGYDVKLLKLNASDYGVPQNRIRIFFVGIRRDLSSGLENIYPKAIKSKGSYITIKDALMDLPQIKSGEGQEKYDYTTEPQNEYQMWMRRKSCSVKNHFAMRHTSRLIERFEQIGFGQSVADVDEAFKQRKRGNASEISGKTFSQNNMRPHPEKPSPTIPASFQSNFIHPYLNRNYTAREGARLQSFPDHYIFYGKRTTMSWEKNLSQYQQIGNAVPPLLAKAIGKSIIDFFEKKS